MPEPPLRELQTLNPSAIVELFELTNYDPICPESSQYFTNEFTIIVFQGKSYQPLPMESEGWEYRASGTLPRPTLRISNIGSYIGNLARAYDDLIGAKLIRRRTLVKYLDDQPTADPLAEFQPDIYFVQRKSAENNEVIEFELASVFDLEGKKIPKRRMIASVCMWQYRSAECGYTGGPVADARDEPTSDAALDRCGKRLDSCKLRFGENAVLPFGGFPGLRKIQ